MRWCWKNLAGRERYQKAPQRRTHQNLAEIAKCIASAMAFRIAIALYHFRGGALGFPLTQVKARPAGGVYAVVVMQLNAADNCRVAGASIEPLVLDVRPIFARGGSPCSTIDEAVASLSPGQAFVLLAPFEPAPLFAKLGAKGFCHSSNAMADGCWRIEFTPTGVPQAAGSADSCCCPGH